MRILLHRWSEISLFEQLLLIRWSCIEWSINAYTDDSVDFHQLKASVATIMSIKDWLCTAVVKSVQLYGSGTWPLRTEHMRRLLLLELRCHCNFARILRLHYLLVNLGFQTKSTSDKLGGIPPSVLNVRFRIIFNIGSSNAVVSKGCKFSYILISKCLHMYNNE